MSESILRIGLFAGLAPQHHAYEFPKAFPQRETLVQETQPFFGDSKQSNRAQLDLIFSYAADACRQCMPTDL